MPGVDPVSTKAVYDFLWYSGIAGAMLVLIILIVRGRLVPDVHHQWVIATLTKDRDEWKNHSEELEKVIGELQAGFQRLVDTLNTRGRR